MKFGPVPPRQAEGATAVHTIRQGSLVLKKGTLIGPAEVAALEAAGIKDVVVARLEPGDVSEDKAAAVLRLMESLEEDDDVQQVYANFDIPTNVLERVSAQV